MSKALLVSTFWILCFLVGVLLGIGTSSFVSAQVLIEEDKLTLFKFPSTTTLPIEKQEELFYEKQIVNEQNRLLRDIHLTLLRIEKKI